MCFFRTILLSKKFLIKSSRTKIIQRQSLFFIYISKFLIRSQIVIHNSPVLTNFNHFLIINFLFKSKKKSSHSVYQTGKSADIQMQKKSSNLEFLKDDLFKVFKKI